MSKDTECIGYDVYHLIRPGKIPPFLQAEDYYLHETIHVDMPLNEISEVFVRPGNVVFDKRNQQFLFHDKLSRPHIVDFESDRTGVKDMKGNKRLFIDMDGTLAKFHDEDRYLERMFEKDFFKELKPFDNLVDGIKQFSRENPDVEMFVLSAFVDGEPPYCQGEKHIWLSNHLPEVDIQHRIFTPMGCDKAAYIPNVISQNDYLLDDYNKNLEQFQAAGGSSIKCKNNINHKGLIGPLWQGAVIDNAKSPSEISAGLFSLMGIQQTQAADYTADIKKMLKGFEKDKENPGRGR